MRRVKKQLLPSPFSPIPAYRSPVLPRKWEKDMWESLQRKRAAFAKRREGVNSCMRERGHKCPKFDRLGLRILGRGMHLDEANEIQKNLQSIHRPQTATQTHKTPNPDHTVSCYSLTAFIPFPELLNFSVLLYNLILPPWRSFEHENLILCVQLGSLEIALQGEF